MDRFTAMQVFAEVADRSSLTAAAKALDMSRAMVSRYLGSLEQWLGVRLLHRTTRRVSLTDAGEEALRRCRQVIELTRDVQHLAGARRAAASGKLRVTTSTSFAEGWLAGAVGAFLALHPRAEIEIVALDRAVNLVEERIDLAVRISNRLDPGLVARRLTVCRSVLCASPGYLAARGIPRSPEALRDHVFVLPTQGGRAEFRLRRAGRSVSVRVAGRFLSGETTVRRASACAGTGIALLPTYLVGPDLATGRLVRLLPGYEPETLGLHAVYLSREHQPPLLRAMLDFLIERLAGDVAPWDRDIAAPAKPSR